MAGKKATKRKKKVRGPVNMSTLPGGINPFRKKRSNVFTFNPAYEDEVREEPLVTHLSLFNYDQDDCSIKTFTGAEELLKNYSRQKISWINIAGLRTADVSRICKYFKIHQLTVEDILSVGQRAKADELGVGIYCLLPVLNYHKETGDIEQQQVSLILLDNTVLSFMNVESKDLFGRVRSKLQSSNSRLREKRSDFLFYNLLDAIVDDYFSTIESTGIQIEDMEERIIRLPNSRTLLQLNQFRQKVGAMRRAISPVRDLVNHVFKSENQLIDNQTRQYIKDVYDHIQQANETTDSYRDLIMNLQSLYINQVSLKMNEIMKVLAIVTALFAPLTLIAGIYGMNFDNMPELHTRYGYFITLGVMVLLFLGMLYVFKKRKWF